MSKAMSEQEVRLLTLGWLDLISEHMRKGFEVEMFKNDKRADVLYLFYVIKRSDSEYVDVPGSQNEANSSGTTTTAMQKASR